MNFKASLVPALVVFAASIVSVTCGGSSPTSCKVADDCWNRSASG